MAAWLRAFVLTQVIEIPVYVAVGWNKGSLLRLIGAGAACTAVTHPMLWFVWPHVIHDYTTFVVSGEIGITIVEALIFWRAVPKLSATRACGAALVANGASYGIGELLRALGLFV